MTPRTLALGLLVGGCALLVGCGESNGPAADFKIIPLEDQAKTVTLADFKGKTVLLDFWATYCGPCRDSMPEIQAAYDKFHSKGFEVASISAEPRDLVLAFHSNTKFNYPVYLDPSGAASEAYRVDSIPQFVLIKDGKVVWSQIGFGAGDIMHEVEKAMG